MNTHRLVPITLALLCLVALAGAKCTKTEERELLLALTGKVPDETGALVYPTSSEPVAYGVLLVEPESSEEVVSVAVVVEPEPSSEYVPSVEPEPIPEPICETTVWRGTYYDCHGQIVGYVE